ncbi:MAG: peptide deformylase [Nitrospinae bacterium RIFCSPLOWO2_12_FULL_47_7]|nr:MAG: peptide deformylase [Nitrospinae bacterium RIFCSPLOWO2_12_FULL_47_7]
MAVLKVARLGDPVLRQIAKPVDPEGIWDNKDIQILIDDMIETMHMEKGVGLAAPQVFRPVQVVVLECLGSERYPNRNDFPLMALINPVFVQYSEETVSGWEGCLSLPGLRGLVPRAKEVTLEAYNRTGERVAIEADGFLAIALQHEIDHLNGVVYIDRMTDLSKLSYEEEFETYWMEDDVIEA